MIELLLVVTELLPDFAREHASTLGAAGGGTVMGGSGVYLWANGRFNQLETLVTTRFETLARDVKNTARASSERDAYFEGKLDEVATEARAGRTALHDRLDGVNTRLSFLEGRLNGRT